MNSLIVHTTNKYPVIVEKAIEATLAHPYLKKKSGATADDPYFYLSRYEFYEVEYESEDKENVEKILGGPPISSFQIDLRTKYYSEKFEKEIITRLKRLVCCVDNTNGKII